MPLLLNMTESDITLVLNGRPYTFPALASGNVPPKLVEIGNQDIAQWFMDRTFSPGATGVRAKAPSWKLVRYEPKDGELVEVVARYFMPDVQPPPAAAPSMHSWEFVTRHGDADAKPPPKPSAQRLEGQRREMIADMPHGILKAEARRRGLIKNTESPPKMKLVDMLVASDYQPPGR